MQVNGFAVTITSTGDVFAEGRGPRRKIGTVRKLDRYEVVSGTTWKAVPASRIGHYTADTRAAAVTRLVENDPVLKYRVKNAQ